MGIHWRRKTTTAHIKTIFPSSVEMIEQVEVASSKGAGGWWDKLKTLISKYYHNKNGGEYDLHTP